MPAGVRRSSVDGARTAAAPCRRPPSRHGGGGLGAGRRAPGRHGRCGHAFAAAQAAARRADGHPPVAAHCRMRAGAGPQRRAGDAHAHAARLLLSGRARGPAVAPERGTRLAVRLLARRDRIRIPARGGARGADARRVSARRGDGRCRAAIRQGHPGQGAGADRRRAGADRRTALRAVLPDRLRRGAVCPQPGHPLPGARLGGQFGGVLLPGHHRGGSGERQHAVRALPVPRAQRAARHRRRFRAPAARGGHPVHLREIRPDAHRAGRGADHLPHAQRPARCRPRARHRPGCDRTGGQGAGVVGRPARVRAARRAAGAGPGIAAGAALGGAGRATARVSAPSVAARRRLCHRAGQAVAAGADRERGHAGSPRHPVGQGRSRIAALAEGGRAGTGHADGHPPHARHARCAAGAARALRRIGQARHAAPARRGPGHLRHDQPRRDHRRVPDRIARAAVDAAPPAAAHVLRPGDPGGHRAAGADPGRHGASVPAAARGDAQRQPRLRDLSRSRGEGGVGAHAGCADLPGAGDGDRHESRRIHRRRGRPPAPRHGRLEAQGQSHRAPGTPDAGDGRGAALRSGLCRGTVPADGGVCRIRFSREPCGRLRQAGLRQQLPEMPRAGGILCRAAQQPADGVLLAVPTGAGGAAQPGARAAGGCDGQCVGQHAARTSARGGRPARHPARPQPYPRYAAAGRRAHRGCARAGTVCQRGRSGAPCRARSP